MFMNLFKKIGLIILVISFFYAPAVGASFDDFYEEFDEFFSEDYQGEVIINNNIKASSNTGNNIAENGEIINGKSESSIKVKTIINGELVEDVDIVERGEGENQEIIYQSSIEVIDSKLKIETKKEVNPSYAEASVGKFVNKDIEKEIKKEVILDNEFQNEINKTHSTLNIAPANEDSSFQEGGDEFSHEREGQDEIVEAEEVSVILKLINIILDIFKNNIDRISKLF